MYQLEEKYLALLHEAERRQLPDINGIRLCFQVLSLATSIDRDCAALLAPHGLSEGRFVLLFLLEAAGANGMAPNTLATRAGITRATVTGLLDGLEREGLVERKNDPSDRRALLIQPTPKGKELSRQLFRRHTAWISTLFGDLSAEESAVLTEALHKVAGKTGRSHREPDKK